MRITGSGLSVGLSGWLWSRVMSLLNCGIYSLALLVARRFQSWIGSLALPKSGSLGGVVMVGMSGRAAMVLAAVPVGV